ncbi:hypothetical protein V5O48_017444, partial [Marasmius crinis-equi]
DVECGREEEAAELQEAPPGTPTPLDYRQSNVPSHLFSSFNTRRLDLHRKANHIQTFNLSSSQDREPLDFGPPSVLSIPENPP